MFLTTRSALRLRNIALSTGLAAVCLIASISVHAQGNSSIAQGFQTKDTNVVAAALVSVARDDPKSIELSSTDNLARLVGVVSNKSLIDLSDGSDNVRVVRSGLTLALVSDLNGKVLNGDKITASPIEGVGMKATQSGIVAGAAQGELAGVQTEARTITSKTGERQTVHIGLLPVQVSVAFYSAPEKKVSFIPGPLQDLANNVTGKNVSPIRVLVAALIVLLLFVSITVLLYSAVRSSIISIGRNPLSQAAVRKSLLQVGVTVLAVLLFAALFIYLVLTV